MPTDGNISLKQELQLVGKVATSTEVTAGPGAVNWSDLGKGALVAVFSAIFPLVQQSISDRAFNLADIGYTALSALLGFLAYKFISPTKVITTYKSDPSIS